MATGLLLISVFLCGLIFDDYIRVRGFTSFSGKTEYLTLTASAAESNYQWSLAGAYICYDPEWPIENEAIKGFSTSIADDRLCHGPHGTSTRKHIPLGDQISLAFVQDTSLEIAVAAIPRGVEPDAFAAGTAPSAILIIKSAAGIQSTETCPIQADGSPVLIDNAGHRAALPSEAEIHIPVDEHTLMPFVGSISVGQTNSADTPNILRTGVLAVYRAVYDLWGTNEPQLVRETNLFPGDVLKFERRDGCIAKSSGFLRAEPDDKGGLIEVVASFGSKNGVAILERSTPGADNLGGRVAIELKFIDAVFTHPLTLWLGFFITVLVVWKEALEFMSSDQGTPSGSSPPQNNRKALAYVVAGATLPTAKPPPKPKRSRRR